MKRWTFLGMAAAVTLLLAAAGCGKAGDAVSKKVTEKALETALSQDGKKVDVTLGKDGGVSSMHVEAKDGANQKMDLSVSQNGGQVTVKGTDENGKAMNVQISNTGDASSMSMQSEDGAMKMLTGDAAKVPDDFPKDIPQYPGAKVTMVQTMAEQQMYHIQAQTPDAMDKVAGFCKQQYTGQGWTEKASMNQSGDTPMTMLSYEKGERILNIVLSKGENGTEIQLNTGLQ